MTLIIVIVATNPGDALATCDIWSAVWSEANGRDIEHVYLRQTSSGWVFCVYVMGGDKQESVSLAEDLVARTLNSLSDLDAWSIVTSRVAF